MAGSQCCGVRHVGRRARDDQARLADKTAHERLSRGHVIVQQQELQRLGFRL